MFLAERTAPLCLVHIKFTVVMGKELEPSPHQERYACRQATNQLVLNRCKDL